LQVGVIVIVIEGMMSDLVLFLEIFGYTMVGFTLAFIGLVPHTHGREEDIHDGLFPEVILPEATLGAPAAVLAVDDDVRMRVLKSTAPGYDDETDDGPWQLMKTISLPLWAVLGELRLNDLATVAYSQPVMWFYSLLSTIVLVNLLIAMFSDTYTRVLSAADTEYRLQKSVRTYLYRSVVLTVPPPLNLPYLVYVLFFQHRSLLELITDDTNTVEKAALNSSAANPEQSSAARTGKYVEAFLKRLKNEQHLEIEALVKEVHDMTTTNAQSQRTAAQTVVGDLRGISDACRKIEGAVEGLSEKLQSLAARVERVENGG